MPPPSADTLVAPLVRLRGVRVALPDRSRKRLFQAAPLIEIVKGVDLDIARGAAVGLVGESGSGKTTLGRTLVRLIKPSAGELLYDGRDLGIDDAARSGRSARRSR